MRAAGEASRRLSSSDRRHSLSYAQQGHNQTVRQHPCHLCRGGIKPMAEPQF